MALVVSRRPHIVQAWVRSQVNPCEICSTRMELGQVFFEQFGFPVNIIPP
jgi:hypothetical protein